jgi:hypothetical protein
MMDSFHTPGLPANWLNAWLAALGITIVLPEAKLSWTTEPTPSAIFHHDSVVDSLAENFPTLSDVERLAIARELDDLDEFPRKVPSNAYRQRSQRARRGDTSLASTVTDLAPSDEPIAHSPFDPTVPRGLTIHQRLMACRARIDDDPRIDIANTLAGRARRQPLNGLGFDYTRLVGPTVPGRDNFVDPVIEVLSFIGLQFTPVRGDGRRSHTRGWNTAQSRRGAFTWPSWRPPLDAAAIDGLLDRFWTKRRPVEGIEAVYGSVAYQQRGSADATRGYGSERLQ